MGKVTLRGVWGVYYLCSLRNPLALVSSPSPGAFKHSCVEHSEKGLRGLPSTRQVNENAKKDLKEGLLLYNTENNVGLKNAWNIIQAEVRGWAWQGGGGAAQTHPG